MNGKTLQALGGIYFEQIRTGLSEYDSEIKKLNQQEAFEVFEKLWKTSFFQQTYVDFYYYELKEEARGKIEELLTIEETAYLRAKTPALFFSLDEILLTIITKLNEAEMLFSTIYFVGESGHRSTWWGNYGQEYIVFTDKKNPNLGGKDETVYGEK